MNSFSDESHHMDQQPSSKTKKRNLIVAVSALAVISLIIGLSVGLTRSKGGDSSSSNNNDKKDGPAIASSKVSFSRSSSFINSICANADSSSTCEVECDDAKCCDPLNNGNCVSTDEDGGALASCVAYAKCQLSGDPAPLDLPQICSMDSLKVDSTACQDACADASCCFSEDDTCHADKFLMCMDYAPCQNLRNTTALPAAPSNLDEICQLEDSTQCKDLCDSASCCIDTDLDKNCFASDFVSCASYASCGFLVLDQMNTQVPKPPAGTNISDICDPTLLTNEDARKTCSDTCQQADCCTESGSDILKNCFLSDPFGCLEYSQCAYLDVTGGDVPTAPVEIKQVCTPQNILSSSQGREDCDAICSAPEVSCCFDWSYNGTCATGENAYACSTYYPCASLFLAFGGDGNLTSPDESIADICSYNQVKEDRTACENICEPASCCKSKDDEKNCFYENPNVCAEYAFHCGTLFLPMGNVEAPEPPANIDEVCGPLSFFGKSQECEDLCAGKPACCTELTGDESCLTNSPEQCAKWLVNCS